MPGRDYMIFSPFTMVAIVSDQAVAVPWIPALFWFSDWLLTLQVWSWRVIGREEGQEIANHGYKSQTRRENTKIPTC